MKGKKFLSGVLAVAVTATTVLPGAAVVKAEDTASTPLASYNFDETLGEGKAIVTGLGEFQGDVTYVAGRTGNEGDFAVKTGEYGIALAEKNVGKNWSVSMWVKPDGAISLNTPVIFAGHHDPEKWVSISGNDSNSSSCKVWTRDPNSVDFNGWITVNNATIKREWTAVTLTEEGNTLTTYVNGVKVAEGNAADALNNEAGQVLLAVNNWDSEFNGAFDDVNIYDTVLSEEEVAANYAVDLEMVKKEDVVPVAPVEKKAVVEFSFDDEDGFTSGDYTVSTVKGEVTSDEESFAGKSAYFNGSSYVKVLDSNGKSPLTGLDECTISYYGKTLNEGGNCGWSLFAERGGVTTKYLDEHYLGVLDLKNKINVERYNGGARAAANVAEGAFADWKKVSIVVRKDGTDVYVNGDLVSTVESSNLLTDILGDDSVLQLGKANWGDEYYKGYIDNFTVLNYAQTAGEVKALYVKETTPAILPDAVSEYSFDGELGKDVKAVVKGLGDYSGEAEYAEGHSDDEADQSVSLNGYGLKLPDTNLGDKWTVSMWVKPNGTIKTNTPVVFLGYHNPEKWVAVSGNNNGQNCKVWTNGTSSSGLATRWKTVTTVDLAAAEWSLLTLTEDGDTLTAYINGAKIGSGDAVDAFNNEDGSIWLGVSNWDPAFSGCIDDVTVFDQALSASQVRYMYDGSISDALFESSEFTANESLSMTVGRTKNISVSYPSSVSDDITVAFASADESIATVSETGLVTAVAAGETTITVTGTVGAVVKTAEVKVTVSESNKTSDVVVDYDFTQAIDGELVDNSGNNNNATLHGDEGFDYEFVTDEAGNRSLQLNSNNAYADLPISIMDSLTEQEEFTIETTFAKSSACGNNAWLFCLGSNVKSTGTNYLFLSPNFGGSSLRTGIKNNSTEMLFGTAIQPTVGKEYTVTMVFDNGTVKLYWNGVLIKYNSTADYLQSGYSIMNDVVNPGTSNEILGYIGKSCWAADKNYQGTVSSFKVYDKALTDEEAQSKVFGTIYEKSMAACNVLGKNGTADAVAYNLDLPTLYEEAEIKWQSSNEAVITNEGVVKAVDEATEVTLTGTVKSGSATASYTIKVVVVPADMSALEEILVKAEKTVKDTKVSEDSREKLQALIDKAAKVSGQSEIDSLVASINRAIANCEANYSALYKNPFVKVDGSLANNQTELVLDAAETATLFTVASEIEDMVDVTYTSSNDKVATYENGKVTAVASGYAIVTTTVTAKYDGYAVEFQRLVKVPSKEVTAAPTKAPTTAPTAAPTVAPTAVPTTAPTVTTTEEKTLDMSAVAVSADLTVLKAGQTAKVTVSLPDAVKAAKPVVSFSATGSVSVSEDGVVTAVKGGSGKVFVKIATTSKTVTKVVKFTAYQLKGEKSVKKGKKITLKVEGASSVKWTSSNKKIATVSKKGVVTGKKKGTVTIKATVDGVTFTKKIKVK